MRPSLLFVYLSIFSCLPLNAGSVFHSDAAIFGVNTHFLSETVPGELAQIAAAWSLIRTDFHWAEIEQAPGVYNFSAHDVLFAGARAQGLRLLFTMGYRNSLYDDGQSPRSDAGRAAFARWAVASASHYRELAGGPTGVLWELTNEPNLDGNSSACDVSASSRGVSVGENDAVVVGGGGADFGGWFPCANGTAYGLLAAAVGSALKGAFPDELFVGPASAQAHGTIALDLPFYEDCFSAGALEYWDAVTHHPYKPFSPEQGEAELLQLQALVAAAAPAGMPPPPVLAGEVGYSTAVNQSWGGPWANETVQSKYLPRLFLLHAGLGVNLTVYYDWVDDGPLRNYSEDNFGTVYALPAAAAAATDAAADGPPAGPFAPKPAYLAAVALRAATAGANCTFNTGLTRSNVSQPAPAPDVVCFQSTWACAAAAPPAIAVWCDAHEAWLSPPLRVPVPTPGACYDATNWLGAAAGRLCADAGPSPALLVEASAAPLYLHALPASSAR